jgi:thiosulfate/3-mercaptopyruvate sulfurtransferase
VPELVPIEWLDEHLGSAGVLVLDPRTRERYLSGHASGAVHAPIRHAFDAEGRLRSGEELAAWLGSRGVSRGVVVAVLDDYDGQKGSTLAWILEYLGHPAVKFLNAPFARWRDSGRELFYRPVGPEPAEFTASRHTELRASREDVAKARGRAVDVRAPEEFDAASEADEPGGHIPGAVNLDWRAFVTDSDELFADPHTVLRLLESAGLSAGDKPIVYCRSGPRAAVAIVAMSRAGVPATLYDGSFLDWTRARMPVESHSKVIGA